MSRALLLVVILASGCSAWHWQRDPAPMVLEGKRPKRVVVMLPDSSRVMVWAPTIVTDTLRGSAADTGGVTIAIPVAEIRRLELHEPDAFATLLLLLGAALLYGLWVASQIPIT